MRTYDCRIYFTYFTNLNILGLNLQETDTERKENNYKVNGTRIQMEDVDCKF